MAKAQNQNSNEGGGENPKAQNPPNQGGGNKGGGVSSKRTRNSSVSSFGIEANEKRNGNIALQSIVGEKLRGRIEPNRTVDVRDRDGEIEQRTPIDQAIHLSQYPTIPGQCLFVNPETLEYKIIDPLYEDKNLARKLSKALDRNSPYSSDRNFGGMPPKEGTLDVHRFKTLVEEMVNLVESGDATLKKGNLPSKEDIKKMDGKVLLNPGLRTPSNLPRFREDYEEWQGQPQPAHV